MSKPTTTPATTAAIARYEAARQRYADQVAADTSGKRDRITARGERELREARAALVRALLAGAPDDVVQPTCGVIVGDRLYLAAPGPEDADITPLGCETGAVDEGPAMHLVVASLADVRGMGAPMPWTGGDC